MWIVFVIRVIFLKIFYFDILVFYLLECKKKFNRLVKIIIGNKSDCSREKNLFVCYFFECWDKILSCECVFVY